MNNRRLLMSSSPSVRKKERFFNWQSRVAVKKEPAVKKGNIKLTKKDRENASKVL